MKACTIQRIDNDIRTGQLIRLFNRADSYIQPVQTAKIGLCIRRNRLALGEHNTYSKPILCSKPCNNKAITAVISFACNNGKRMCVRSV